MNYLRKYQKYLKKYLVIILIAFFISLILYYKLNNSDIITELKNIEELLNNNHFNLILPHFMIIIILSISILIGLGLIFIPIYFIYEYTCIFYNMLIFLKIFSIKGLLFSLIYNFILKGVYLVLIFIFIRKMLKIFSLVIKNIFNKISIDKNVFLSNLKIIILILGLIFMNDLIIYFGGTKILLKFLFILK